MLRSRRTALAALAGSLVLGLLPALAPRASAALPVRLDPELVSRLAAASPGDELITFVHANDVATSEAAALGAGLGVIETWDRIGVTVAAGTPSEIRALQDVSGLTYLEADRPITFFQETSQQATRADVAAATFTAADGSPLDGSGSSIAIVDSGIRGDHPAFGDRVKVNLKNVCASPACYDLTETQSDTRDELWVPEPVTNDTDTASQGGHGTHVAGIAAAGVDNVTAAGATFTGSAPGATLIGLSVGQLISVYGGNSGLNWVLEHHADPCGDASCPPIVSVNNSYGPVGGGEYDPESATAKLQHELVLEGVTVVWAAGNDGGDGSAAMTNPPGQSPIPGVISVASYNDAGTGTSDGTLSDFSSRGAATDPTTFPDLAAPGEGILSSCGPALPICKGGDILDPDYGVISGTSMAAPHIAGYVAILKDADPSLTPGEIEFLLEATARKLTFGAAYEADPRHEGATTSFDKGHGLVDVAAAVAAAQGGTVTPPPAATPCPVGSTTFEDPAGDASFAGQGIKAEPNVDLTSVRLTYVPAAGEVPAAVTTTIAVEDLRGDTDPPSVPSDGEVFDLGFSVGGEAYYLRASRSLGEQPTFALRQPAGEAGTGDTAVPGAVVTGAFDAAGDMVTMSFPMSAIANADGAVFSSLTATAWTSEGVLLLRADAAAGTCPFTAATAPATGAVDGGTTTSRATAADGGSGDRSDKGPRDDRPKDKRPKDKRKPGDEPVDPPPPTPSNTTTLVEATGTVPMDSINRTCGTDALGTPTGPAEQDPACIPYAIGTDTPDAFGFVIVDLVPTEAGGTELARDYDVYVYDAAGKEVGNAATVGGREHAFVQVPGGSPAGFTVVVQPYNALEGDTFDITISFGSLDDQPR